MANGGRRKSATVRGKVSGVSLKQDRAKATSKKATKRKAARKAAKKR